MHAHAVHSGAAKIFTADVERIADRDDKSGFAVRNWDHLEATRVLRPNLFDDGRRNHHRRQIDPGYVRLRGQRTRDVGFGDDAVLN